MAGALFPLGGLPAWLTVLSRLDPAAYGIDPLRRAVLGGAGHHLGLTLFGHTLAIWTEEAMLLAWN